MKIIQKARESKALKDSAMMMGGSTLASGIAAIALIIFSRFLGPEKFGVFSIGFSVVLLLSRLADGGVNIALQKYIAQTFEGSRGLAKKYFNSGLHLKSIISLGIIFTFFILSEPLSTNWLKTEHLAVVRAAIILSMATVAYEFVATIHQSTRKFAYSIFMGIFQAMSKAIVALGIWVFHIADPMVAFVMYAASPLVGVIYGVAKLPKWATYSTKNLDPKVKSKILSIVKFTSIAVVAGAIGDNIDVLMVKSYLTEYDTGLYSAGARLAILVSMLGYSLGTVLNPRVARYKDAAHFAPFVKKAFLISLAAILAIIFVVPLTKTFIIITAGRQYIEATGSVQFLLSAGLVAIATTPFVSMFYVLERPAYFALSGIVQTITLIAANVILIPQMGILGAGQAKLIMRVVTLIFTIIYARYAIIKTHKVGFRKLLFTK